MRTIEITKSGKSTIIEINNSGVVEVFVINKLTDLSLRNNVIVVETEIAKIMILHEELVNKLASVDAKDYLVKASAANLFNQ